MSDTILKNKSTKELFKKLTKHYEKDNGANLKLWLNSLKDPSKVVDGKISGIFNSNKINIETSSESGTYNLILLWIIQNKDKFQDFDFDGIPSSSFIDIENELKKNKEVVIKKKSFKTVDDVKEWSKNPTSHPIDNSEINPMSVKYYEIWNKAFDILKKSKNNHDYILNILPKNHLLFNGKFDFLYNSKTAKNNTKEIEYDDIFDLLTMHIEDTETKTTAFDTELELFRSIFSKENNLNDELKDYFSEYSNKIIKRIINPIANFDFDNNKIEDVISRVFPKLIYNFITFLNKEKFSNGVIIFDYLENEVIKSRCPEWIKDFFKIYSIYNNTWNDINDLLKVDSTIVENRENKVFKIIEDPLDKYFKKYEDALEILKNPKYKRFIDQQTLKPIDKKNYLNDKEYADFEKEFKLKESALKKDAEIYKTKYKEYETIKKNNPTAKSPTPPKQRFIIQLPNGRNYINGQEKPFYIADDVMKSFYKDYEKSKSAIEEYVKVKKMSYLDLVKYIEKKSPSKEIKNFAKDNILLSMTRDQINDNILYDELVDESQLADRCNDSSDILTKDDFDSEDYPLAKLQLLVRLKIYNNDKYKTECIYAPALYNYLVECINTRKPFINPLTRVKYSEEHINELMKVMKIINPNIERPYFLKPITDTKLKIDYYAVRTEREANPHNLEFYSIDIYRQFGDFNFKIYHICTIPSNIEPTGEFATNSNDLSSTTMLFRIFKLFNEGRLLHKYVPPYCIRGNGYYEYIALMIHFNRYQWYSDWTIKGNVTKTKKEIVDMFINYAQEINNYSYT
jgi:hypothetical protein